MGDGTYLRISEVVARLREAGFPESESTVRRMVDAGVLTSYRIGDGGHRRVSAESVDELISRRRAATVRGPGEREGGVTSDPGGLTPA